MDVVRLGLPGTTSYLPDDIVEDYTSMIWTERYQDPGEFELKTPRISETFNLLPEMTLISHLDTKEVMMVESRLIGVDDNGYPELTVTGRSLDAFLEHRHVEASYGKRRKMTRMYTATGAAVVLIWNVVDNWSDKDVTREDDHPWTTKDQIPNVSVSDSVAVRGDSRNRWLKEGPLYPQLLDILIRDDLGIRIIRPKSTTMTRISVATGLATRGEVTRTIVPDVTSLRFDIYRGVDRSNLQSTNSKVIFSTLRGDIEKVSYLFSNKDLKTACEVMSGAGGADVYRPGGSGLTGLDRRVMSYDAGEPEEAKNKPTDPGKNATTAENNTYEADLADWRNRNNAIIADFLADIADEALRALKKQRRVSLLTGDISPLSLYKYKTHYDLGDTVTLYGDYNQTEQMIVSEYVRTEDSDGDRGFPGLVLP